MRGQIERSAASEHLKPKLIALYHQAHVMRTMLNESRSFTLDTQSREPLASLGSLPLIVLTPGASGEEIDEKQRVSDILQQELVGLSTAGRQIIAPDSGHGIHLDQPELVITAVDDLVALVRDQSAEN